MAAWKHSLRLVDTPLGGNTVMPWHWGKNMLYILLILKIKYGKVYFININKDKNTN